MHATLADEADVLVGLFGFPRLILSHGKGTHVWDTDGRRYLDFTAGLGVSALGHGREDLAAVAQAQFVKLAHASNLFGNEPSLRLANRLKTASGWADKVWFCNSGTESIEAALKFGRLIGAARGGPDKHVFVAMERGFHGRTYGALSITHEPAYRLPFAPNVPGVRFGAFNDLAAVEQAMGDDVCALVVEPVQGEGGVYPADPGFLAGLRALCDRYGAALVFDEIQCGVGRTGHLFAHQWDGVVPDILCLAKPLAAGLPVGATLVNAAVAQCLKPGHHGSTFAGGPVVAAVGLALLDIVEAPEFLTNVRAQGELLAAGLRDIAAGHAAIAQARGRGLMQALVVSDPKALPPATVVTRARALGLLVTRAGKDAVRLLPPLNISASEVQQALTLLREALS